MLVSPEAPFMPSSCTEGGRWGGAHVCRRVRRGVGWDDESRVEGRVEPERERGRTCALPLTPRNTSCSLPLGAFLFTLVAMDSVFRPAEEKRGGVRGEAAAGGDSVAASSGGGSGDAQQVAPWAPPILVHTGHSNTMPIALRHGASPVRGTCCGMALEGRAASGRPARLLCLQA